MVRTGYSFRAALDSDPAASVGVIQMKDLGDAGEVDLASLARVSVDVRPESRVRQRDIVVRSRGDRATCALVAGDPGCAIVAAPLLLVRVVDQRVLPAYLSWYINQAPTQAHLAKRSEGSNVKMITKRTLLDLEIAVPELDRQRDIVALASLWARHRGLESELERLRSAQLSRVMMRYAEGSEG